MAAAGGGREDPEEAAEFNAVQVYNKMVVWRAALVLLVLAGVVVALLGDYTWAVLALPRLPSWSRPALACFLVSDVLVTLGRAATTGARRWWQRGLLVSSVYSGCALAVLDRYLGLRLALALALAWAVLAAAAGPEMTRAAARYRQAARHSPEA